jgi:hypothetical protein
MTAFDELSPRERDLARALHAGLRGREGEPDLVVGARLRAARARAVEAGAQPRRGTWLYASGGLVAAAAVAVLLVLRPPQPANSPTPAGGTARTVSADAIDILTDDLDAEFYEDLDLYRWLEREHDGAA